ncbi:hypothetical protein EVAR_66017_1 [Eumeta japonica]|uniref:Uncharacterized protein n=1 Tax=Eumeta variegata TaxID=151549 RepID=A0A4C1Z3E3_EUMVA|nr:hypothetical protein EVAR_66017_1 [Eumeta japonica]
MNKQTDRQRQGQIQLWSQRRGHTCEIIMELNAFRYVDSKAPIFDMVLRDLEERRRNKGGLYARNGCFFVGLRLNNLVCHGGNSQ